MNADKANRWLTLLANFGVVAGLVLLIFEIRQNSELVRAQIHQARADSYIDYTLLLAESEYILPIWQKVSPIGQPIDMDVVRSLDAVDRGRIYLYAQSRAGDYSNLYFQYRNGYLDEEYYQARIAPSMRFFAPMWAEFDILDLFTSSFRAEVERLVAEE
jgi:hypothetical protein